MTKLKLLPAITLSLALTAGTLAGCASDQGENIVFDDGTQSARTQTGLTFFGFKYEALNVTAIEDSLHGFMDEYPDISISYDGIKSPEYFDVLNKRLAAGMGDDIFMVDHERVLELGGQGRLADLSSVSTLGQFSELAKGQMTASGAVYYLPTSISAFGLYCNLDLLKQHGQKIPENLAELEEVCDYFVSQGITPIVANNDISLKTIAIARAMLPYYQQEDPAGSIIRLNSDRDGLTNAFSSGFMLVGRMLERGWVDRGEALNTAKTKDDLELFSKGDRPFMLTGAWAVPRLRGLEPDFDFEVRPYPVMEDGCVLVINIDTRISVNADSPHRKEAIQFVEYLTQSDPMWEFVNSQCSFSPLEENRLAQENAVAPIGPYLSNGRSVIGSDDNLNFPVWDISRQCIVGMLEGDTAGDAVSNMEKLLDEWSCTK